MKRTFLAGVVVLALMMTPVFAAFSDAKTEISGNGLSCWSKSGSDNNRFAASETTASTEQNRMWTYFVAPSENYAANLGRHSNSTLEKDLSAGLAGGSGGKGAWNDITTHSSTGAFFVGGAGYGAVGDSGDNSHSHSAFANNFTTDDDKSIAQIRSIPAPGAILLSSLGAGLIGWLRSRRVL